MLHDGAASNADLGDASYDWILKFTGLKGSHNVVWPAPSSFPTPSLTTGLIEMGRALFDDDQREWRQAVESGDLEKYRKFLKEACLKDSDNKLEATALENGRRP